MIIIKKNMVPKPKIIVIGNTQFEKIIESNIDIPSLPVSVSFKGGNFEDALQIINEYKGEADVFVTGASIVNALRERVLTPIVPIIIDGFDIIDAILRAREKLKRSEPIYLILYDAPIDVITEFSRISGLNVQQIGYKNIFEIREIIENLAQKGVKLVVTTTLVYLAAAKFNIEGIIVYSSKSIEKSFQEAIHLAHSQKKIKYLSEQRKAIANLINIGVISCNSAAEISHINKKALQILDINGKNVLSLNIQHIMPNLSLQDIELSSGNGVFDIITKVKEKELIISLFPIVINDINNGFVLSFQEAEEISKAEYKIRKKQIKSGFKAKFDFDDILGNSKFLKANIEKARIFAESDFDVLIQGETGTGKELIAHAIHNASNRRNGLFLSINCASLSASLLESELFGYENGAFTGSNSSGKKGLLELAHNGTLFADEIGDLSSNIQIKLLRFLEEKEIIKVGGNELIPVNVRIIAATNKNLKDEVRKGNLRLDFYQRVSILTIETIPLRDREEDIPILLTFFLKKHNNGKNCINEKIIHYIIEKVKGYHWTGNIRELETLAINFVVVSKNTDITFEISDKIINELIINNIENDFSIIKKDIDLEQISEALKITNNNKSAAARLLGISRVTLWRKLSQE